MRLPSLDATLLPPLRIGVQEALRMTCQDTRHIVILFTLRHLLGMCSANSDLQQYPNQFEYDTVQHGAGTSIDPRLISRVPPSPAYVEKLP